MAGNTLNSYDPLRHAQADAAKSIDYDINGRSLTSPTQEQGQQPMQLSGDEAVQAKQELAAYQMRQAVQQREQLGPTPGGTHFGNRPKSDRDLAQEEVDALRVGERQQAAARDERQADGATREKSDRELALEDAAAYKLTVAAIRQEDRSRTVPAREHGGMGY